MSNEQKPVAAYGFASDDVKINTFAFGLNAGNVFLTKFGYIPNGGEKGAEADALDIIFNIGGTDKNYRCFPIKKAYRKMPNGAPSVEVTDPSEPEMIDAMGDFNARITHILHCFQEIDVIKTAFARPIAGFKEFCQIAESILPKDFSKIPLDIFLAYQYQPSKDQTRTYLEVPKKMSYGRWLAKSQPGKRFQEIRITGPQLTKDTPHALQYVEIDQNGPILNPDRTYANIHPFIRNGWFMLSPMAQQTIVQGAASAAGTALASNAAGAATQSALPGAPAPGTAAGPVW